MHQREKEVELKQSAEGRNILLHFIKNEPSATPIRRCFPFDLCEAWDRSRGSEVTCDRSKGSEVTCASSRGLGDFMFFVYCFQRIASWKMLSTEIANSI